MLPQSQVVAEKLYNRNAIAAELFGEKVKLHNRIVEGFSSNVAGAARRVKDFVAEDGEVERKSKADRVGRSKFSLRDMRSCLECFLIGILNVRALVSNNQPCRPHSR